MPNFEARERERRKENTHAREREKDRPRDQLSPESDSDSKISGLLEFINLQLLDGHVQAVQVLLHERVICMSDKT